MQGRPFHVFVDSDYRESGSSGSFRYRLSVPRNAHYDSVAVMQASLPKTFYMVRDGANTLTLQEGVSSATITIPAGNYSMASFRTVLQAALRAGSPNGYTYTITQPVTTSAASTAKYTYTVSGNGGVQPSFVFGASSRLYQQMGFEYGSTVSFVADSLTSANVVQFNTINGLMIKSDLVEGNGTDSVHGSAVLQEIYSFNTFDYANIGFQNTNLLYSAKRIKTSQTDIATFTITDTDDNIIDFNGGSLNFSLVFFRRDDYHEFAEKDLKMRWFADLTKPQ
jgi:hypothetical protein